MADIFEPQDVGRPPAAIFAIKLVYKEAGRKRTVMRLFASKSDFEAMQRKVEGNWNAIMEGGVNPLTGESITVEATLMTGVVEWETMAVVPGLPTWQPEPPPLPKAKPRRPGAPRTRKVAA